MRSQSSLEETRARWLMRVKIACRILPAFALAAALTMSGAFAQQSQPMAGMHPAKAHTGMKSGNMSDQCKKMMAMHGQMMADMKAMDARLEEKVAAMNAANGDAKVEATAAVVNEMVTQRKQMMAQMSGMRDHMMAHMGEHMAQSGSAAMKQSMADCPMMQGMKDMDGK